MIVVVPGATPETIPALMPTVAVEVLLLLQVPPTVASLNVVVKPAHTFDAPVIADGVGLTVTVVITLQPVV